MKLNLIAHSITHPGKIRNSNEDSVFQYISPEYHEPTKGLFIVADGVGGHKGGEIASKMAIETVFTSLRFFLETDESQNTRPVRSNSSIDASDSTWFNHFSILEPKIKQAITLANQAIFNFSQKEYGSDNDGMGSTITCVLIYERQAIIANVGDSRTYLLRDGVLSQITEDHSYVAELVRHNFISPEAIYTHPHRNVITRSLGYTADIATDIYNVFLEPGDKLLLCSDGLWEMIIQEDEIRQVIETKENQKATEILLEKANNYGGKDNIGIVLVEIVESPESN